MQAQRKFASISGGSNTKTLPSQLMPTKRVAMVASTHFDTKSHTESIAGDDAILQNEPKPPTSEFLTFLCFRGTPVLPEHLAYIKTAPNGDPNDTASTSSLLVKVEKKSTAAAATTENPDDDSAEKNGGRSTKDQNAGNNKPQAPFGGASGTNASSDADADDKPATQSSTTQKYMAFAVRKRADMVSSGPKKAIGPLSKKNPSDQQQKGKKAGTPTNDGESSKQQKAAKAKLNDSANKNGSPASMDGANRSKRKLRGNLDDSQSDKEMASIKPTKIARDSSAKASTTSTEPIKVPKASTRNTKSMGADGSTKASDKSPEESSQSQAIRTTRQRSYSLPKTGTITNNQYDFCFFIRICDTVYESFCVY